MIDTKLYRMLCAPSLPFSVSLYLSLSLSLSLSLFLSCYLAVSICIAFIGHLFFYFLYTLYVELVLFFLKQQLWDAALELHMVHSPW